MITNVYNLYLLYKRELDNIQLSQQKHNEINREQGILEDQGVHNTKVILIIQFMNELKNMYEMELKTTKFQTVDHLIIATNELNKYHSYHNDVKYLTELIKRLQKDWGSSVIAS